MLALLALCALAAAPQDREPARPSFGVELSEGPAARAWTGMAPEQAAAKLDWQGLPQGRNDPLWADPALWQRWAGWVRAQAQSPFDAGRASSLAILALLGERTDDAWDHFAHAARSKAHAAALLPLFVPGVDAALVARGIASPGGVAQGLPDGVALAPAIPPAGVPASEVALGMQRIERRSMRVAGVEIGSAKLAFTVTLESDGVQVDVEHLSGGPAHFTLLLPEPADFEIYVEYLDWMREEAPRAPIVVDIHPGAEPRVLFGRYRRRAMPWPTSLPERLPRGIALSGLEVRTSQPAPPEIAAAVAGLRGLFDCPCVLRPGGAADAPTKGSPTVLHLTAADRARKLAGLLSLAEHWALERKSGDGR